MIVQGSFASILGGVSQQVPRERLAGQLSIQENMLSDPVTGLRRRPGLPVVRTLVGYDTEANKCLSQYMEVGSTAFNLFLNCKTGKVVILDQNLVELSNATDSYLVADDISKIRVTSVGGSMWALNTDQAPVVGAPDATKLNPVYEGFFFIRTGAFQKTYQVRFEYGGGSTEFSYTTDNTAANSTPEGIALNLYNLIIANAAFMLIYDVYRNGAYVYVTRRNKSAVDTSQTTVTSTSGQQYIMASAGMQLSLTSDLPAKLPIEANGTVVAVGINPLAMTYYRWNNSSAAWQETGNYSSPSKITNMPVRLDVTEAGVLTISKPDFVGRTAGDSNNNPMHQFVSKGMTGISSFQGRMVLLSGAYVSLSSSEDPLRFTRSTVSALIATDPIETGSGAASSAAFEHGIQFNRDLVLIARTHQAVIPTGNTAITPSNALVVLTSRQDLSTVASPSVIGRTVMACSPVSEDFYGIVELVPSAYTESQYTPQNLTDHIPRYMRGVARHIVGSSTASIALFTSTEDYKRILVHEYIWDGDQRKLVSWHGWNTPLDIATLHFARDKIVIGLKSNGDLLICTIDPRASSFLGASTKPYLDCYSFGTVTDNILSIPTSLRNIDKINELRLAQSEGALAGEPVGIESIDTDAWTIRTVRSFKNGAVAVGWKFTSQMAPTPPMMRDRNDVVIGTAKTTILKYEITTQRSGEFDIHVINNEAPIFDGGGFPLTWSSSELNLGNPQVAGLGVVVVPCRTVSHTTDVILSTDGVRELNILDIEYVLRTEVRPDRKRL